MPDSFKAVVSHPWFAKALGSLVGVMLSMVMIAPEGTRNAVYRGVLGTVVGFIFAPVMADQIWFLNESTWEDHLVTGLVSGFCAWFLFESLARLISSRGTLDRLLVEVLRLKDRGRDE